MAPNVSLSSSIAMKRKRKDRHADTEPLPPSWEVLCLITSYMEPETLAVASCVTTTWAECFSSENLWKTLLIAHHPSLFASVPRNREFSYKHLFSVFDEPDAKRRRKNQKTELKISLSDLIFFVHVSAGSTKSTVTKEGKDLMFGPNEPFQIEADVSDSGFTVDTLKEVKLTWQVIYGDYEKMFTIKDTTRESVDTNLGWFTDELPVPGNRYTRGSTKLVGDVKPSFNGNLLEKVRFGIADSSTCCESLFLDDVLAYLQCFLVE